MMMLIVIIAIMRMNLSAAIGNCLLPIEGKYILAVTKTITRGVDAFSVDMIIDLSVSVRLESPLITLMSSALQNLQNRCTQFTGCYTHARGLRHSHPD